MGKMKLMDIIGEKFMPRKEVPMRELTLEEENIYLAKDMFDQVLAVGDYISYPTYRFGQNNNALAKIRKILRGMSYEGEVIYKIWIVTTRFDDDLNEWVIRRSSMNHPNRCIKLPRTLIMTCYDRPDIKLLVDTKE